MKPKPGLGTAVFRPASTASSAQSFSGRSRPHTVGKGAGNDKPNALNTSDSPARCRAKVIVRAAGQPSSAFPLPSSRSEHASWSCLRPSGTRFAPSHHLRPPPGPPTPLHTAPDEPLRRRDPVSVGMSQPSAAQPDSRVTRGKRARVGGKAARLRPPHRKGGYGNASPGERTGTIKLSRLDRA